MAYSDKELLVATQIAYYDIGPRYLENHPNMPLRELLKANPKIYKNIEDSLNKEGISDIEKSRFQSAIKLYNEIIDEDSEYGDWIIKAVHDDNYNTGFYGCLIETSEDSAIVGFRGSESMDANQFQKDWIDADFKLLNSTATNQQDKATAFMNEINTNFSYDNYATSGHSLGGNLSVHAALTAPKSMQNKITQSKSYDGPGFSAEYLEEHKDEIERMANKIDHYQWSVVGALLYQIPGSNYQTIRTNDEVYNDYNVNTLVQKHDVSFVLNGALDSNGNVINGEMDPFASAVGELSRKIENCPQVVGDAIIWMVTQVSTMSDAEKLAIGAGALVGLAALAVAYPVAAVCGAIAVAEIVLIGFINPEFFSSVLIPAFCGLISSGIEFVESILDIVAPLLEMALGVLQLELAICSAILNGVANIIKDFATWINENFNTGYKYATENPYIMINTYKLRDYAGRIAAVNTRIRNLDQRLNSLYSKFSIWDWWTIAKVDICTEFSWKLERCRTYLGETADEFENVELNLLSQIDNA